MYRVLYPPRPIGKTTPNQLSMYEKTGKWIVQRKFNGTRILLYVCGNTIRMLNRHGIAPKQFNLTSSLRKEILSLDLSPNLEYWLDAELLDAKTKNLAYKNKIVLFDVLQAGKYFFGGPKLLERYEILKKICRNPHEFEHNKGIALKVTENIWLAENFNHDFKARFNDFITFDEIEGVVLKQKESTIDSFGNSEYEVGWQVRCRKSHAGGLYNF